jgi:hypothetical protein
MIENKALSLMGTGKILQQLYYKTFWIFQCGLDMDQNE